MDSQGLLAIEQALAGRAQAGRAAGRDFQMLAKRLGRERELAVDPREDHVQLGLTLVGDGRANGERTDGLCSNSWCSNDRLRVDFDHRPARFARVAHLPVAARRHLGCLGDDGLLSHRRPARPSARARLFPRRRPTRSPLPIRRSRRAPRLRPALRLRRPRCAAPCDRAPPSLNQAPRSARHSVVHGPAGQEDP